MSSTITRAYRYRFYPSAAQRRALESYFGSARWVWNRSLEYRIKAYRRRGESVTGVDFSRLLTRLKRTTRYGWLRATPSTVLVQALRDQDRAFRNYFGGRAKYPRFRKRRSAQAIRFQLDPRRVHRTFDAVSGRLVLTGLGRLKLKWSRIPRGVPKMVTVKRDGAGRYFVSFAVEAPATALPAAPNDAIGVDLGLSALLTDSDGGQILPLRPLRHRMRQLRHAQRVLSRRRRGSGRWARQRRRVARLHARVADARANGLHQVSRRLVNENQVIVTETLNVRGMVRNRRLAGAIHDAGWAELVRQIAYKADWAGRVHVAVDPWFPSTKRCSACRAIREDLTLADRQWRCEACGADHDRDVNAATNLLDEGLRLHRAAELPDERDGPRGAGATMRVEGANPRDGAASLQPASRAAPKRAPRETRTDPAGLSPATRRVRYGTGRAA